MKGKHRGKRRKDVRWTGRGEKETKGKGSVRECACMRMRVGIERGRVFFSSCFFFSRFFFLVFFFLFLLVFFFLPLMAKAAAAWRRERPRRIAVRATGPMRD